MLYPRDVFLNTKLYLLLLLVLCPKSLAWAQAESETSYYNCVIDQIAQEPGAFWNTQITYRLSLNCGRRQGLDPQSQIAYPIKIVRPTLGAAPLKNEFELRQNQVQILDMSDKQTQLKLELTPQQVFFLEVGDLVPLEIKVPHAYHSLLFQLNAMGVRLTNQQGKDLVPFEQFIQKPALDWEALTLPHILDEIHSLSDYGDRLHGPAAIESGIFEGQSLSQAMADSTLLDVYTFLQYLYANPLDYMGRSWRFAEIYASWLLQGAPGPEEEETEQIPDPYDVPYQQENIG